MGWTIHGSNLDRGKRIFLISKVSIPTVGYSQPPIQRVAGFFPRGKSSQGMNCTACTSAKAKNECRYSGARVHGEGQLYLYRSPHNFMKITVRSVLCVRT